MKHALLIYAVAIFFLTSCGGGGAGDGGDEDYIDWTPYYSQDIAVASSDWGPPEVVSVTTPGWEEGVYISPDGNTLYYIYTNVDIFRLGITGEEVVSGPQLDTASQGTYAGSSARNCGEYPFADHFYVTKTGPNSWSTPQPHFLTTTDMGSIGGLHIIENGVKKLAYFMSGYNDGIDSMHYAFAISDVWQIAYTFGASNEYNGYLVPINLGSTDHEYADPWVNDAGTVMFLWSDMELAGQKDIYYSTNPNGIASDDWAIPAWTPPVRLPSPVNTDGDDMQTFVFNESGTDYLYYSTNRGHDDPGMTYEIAIYRVAMPTD